MVRLQLELEPQRVAEIENLMRLTGIRTKKEFFNNSITLFKWAVEERQHGRQIASLDDVRRYRERLRMPALDAVTAITQSDARVAAAMAATPTTLVNR